MCIFLQYNIHLPTKNRIITFSRRRSKMSKKLRSNTYGVVGNICEEIGTELDFSFNDDAKELIGELVWKKLLLYGSDIEAFSKHGKRSTITVDDVKLLARRNSSLKAHLEEKLKGISTTKVENAPKRKKAKTESTSAVPSSTECIVVD